MPKPKSFKNTRNQEPKEYEEEVIQLDRVTRVVKGGRRMRFRATVALGNRAGKVGIGIGKSAEVVGAIKKAVADAKKNMLVIQIHRDTIAHRVYSKFKASKVLLIPAGPGTGIIAGGATRKIVELSGIKNILSKSLGSANRINSSRATLNALKSLRTLKVREFKKAEAPVATAETATAKEPKEEAHPTPKKKMEHKPAKTQEAQTPKSEKTSE